MMRALLGWLVWLALRLYTWRRKSVTFTRPDGSPYLTRWPVWTQDVWPDPEGRTAGTGWYLHRVSQSDHEVELHNHPAPGFAVVLRKGYDEERREAGDTESRFIKYGPLDVHILQHDTCHRIELRCKCKTVRECALSCGAPSWSLFYFGPRHRRGWGFLQPDGTVRRAAHNDGNTGARVERPGTVKL